MSVQDAPSLLLLPSPPEPATTDLVRAAYRRPLTSVISRLSHENKPNTARGIAPVLAVAIASPVLTRTNSTATPKNAQSVYWQRSQSLLAELYSLVAVICAQESIATDLEADDPGAVDVRIILVDYDRSLASVYKPGANGLYQPNSTTVLGLATFASMVHPWKHIFHPSSEAGYELLAAYLKYAEEGKQKLLQSQLIAVDGGLSLSGSIYSPAYGIETTTAHSQHVATSTKSFTKVCLGGTFDHLHPGHKLFLHAAILLLSLADDSQEGRPRCELVVGISSDELLAKKKYAEQLQSWDIRSRAVINFLSTLLNWSTTSATETKAVQGATKELHATFRNGDILVRCVDFHDLYGPTVQEETIEALVVSGETRGGGQAVNDKRRSQGWSVLDVYEIDVLDASAETQEGTGGHTTTSGFESKISSTEIRKQKAERYSRSPSG